MTQGGAKFGTVLGAVLAGGRSSRFGRDKATAAFEGVTMLERVRATLARVTGEVVVIGGEGSEVAEPEPGAGPLQAVIAALREARRRGAEAVVVLACDLPVIDEATVARLAAPLGDGRVARVPRVGGHLQVLAARWEVAALEGLERAWDEGERSLRRACARLAVSIEDDLEARALADVDTPSDLARLLGEPTVRERVTRHPGGESDDDVVAREEPLEIVVEGSPLAVLLRTPSHVEADLCLVAGFLLSEGVIDRVEDLAALEPCRDPAAEHPENRVLVTLAPGVSVPEAARRIFATGASCGLCGKTAIATLSRRLPPRGPAASPRLADVRALDAVVRAAQVGFASTGALHAAALFQGRRLVDVAEDVGRHNAVDKVLGRALRERRLPLSGEVLWVSGRTSFELVQKALVAGVDALVAVGAPTSMAIELARQGGLHLIGFARGGRLNVYAGTVAEDRVVGGEVDEA